METGRVFVSHTSDMARFPGHRSFAQAALDAVVRAGMTPVDMRYFAARDGAPADYCRARVHECEIYIAVVGFRYGSMVPGEEVSYTELEFQAASSAGLPRLVFLLEGVSVPGLRADADRRPVEGFRQRLREAGLVVRTFTSDKDLELEAFHALTELAGSRPSALHRPPAAWMPAVAGEPAEPTGLARPGMDVDTVAALPGPIATIGAAAGRMTNAVAVYWADRAAARLPEYREAIVAYLRTLIDWVNTDPWPRDRRFGGPVLTPAAIERKVRVSAPGRAGEEDLDADDLAQRCRRLVVLGGPGSGKTWLAKRTARRCAENALDALAAGADLDELELPLYSTCSRLFSANGDIREAAASSAVDQLGDLGGPRLSAAVRRFLAERNAPTVLVIDSLDEAHGSQQRLRQADTLPWRIVLTTRPSSWNQQLAIDDTDVSHQVGELQPLRYPEDVEPFIRRWFGDQPARGEDLAAQIARRPGLQQAATVPLVLAFYCIVGGREPLPDFRRDLYGRVLSRMLTGRWRGDEDRQPAVGTCLHTLRGWARPGAEASHPVSGVGTWADDILTERALLGEADQEALDHVAMPLGPADVDTGQTLRRFIHRSIREHLVAEFVARLPADQAAGVLLPHLWFDSDWEYSAPAAIAMHAQHDQLLRDVICRAAGSEQLPDNLSVVDAGWELRKLLARVASESSEADWSREIAEMISHARIELVTSGRTEALSGTPQWDNSNRQARDVLLRLLADPANGWAAEKLVSGLIQLATTEQDKRRARHALIGLLPGHGSGYEGARFVGKVVDGVIQLAATAEEKRLAREKLLGLLHGQADAWIADELVTGVSQLSPTAGDKRRCRDLLLGLIRNHADDCDAAWLVGRAVRLATTVRDKRETRDMLLGLLPGQASRWVADEIVACVELLGTAAGDNRRSRDPQPGLLPRQAEAPPAGESASRVRGRTLAGEDYRRARGMLLGSPTSEANGRTAAGLAAGMIYADPAAEEKVRARQVLLRLLAAETDSRTAAELAGIVSRLGPTSEDNRRSREALLRLLAAEADGSRAAWLTDGIIQADPSAGERGQARGSLLRLLASDSQGHEAARLASRLSRLGPTTEDKRQARDALLRSLAGAADGPLAARLAGWVCRLDPTAEDKRQARDALMGLLARQADGQVAQELAGWVSRLEPTAEDKSQARDALLKLLARHPDGPLTSGLLGCVIQLAATAEDKSQARDALLKLLPTAQIDACATAEMVGTVVKLAATVEDKRQACDALLSLMAGRADAWAASELVAGVIQLGPTAQDKRRAREALLALLASQAGGLLAARLVAQLVQLDPTARDISAWRAWEALPTAELLAAARRNSELGCWLEILPALAPLSVRLTDLPGAVTPGPDSDSAP